MRPPIQSQMTESGERKRRQEKFRKRSRSLFHKAQELATDTDAWVALVVRDRAGPIKSLRSSDNFYWPPSIKDLMDTYPSGQHDFIKKSAVCGFWKVATEDKSDLAMVDVDAVVELLGDADGPRDVSEKATATATASNTREVDRTTSEYDMMDLDMPGAGRAGMEAPASDSMDAARLRSQHHSPQSSEDFGGWQMVHGPIMTRQGGRVSTRVNPKVVLQHWAWVFQRP